MVPFGVSWNKLSGSGTTTLEREMWNSISRRVRSEIEMKMVQGSVLGSLSLRCLVAYQSPKGMTC